MVIPTERDTNNRSRQRPLHLIPGSVLDSLGILGLALAVLFCSGPVGPSGTNLIGRRQPASERQVDHSQYPVPHPPDRIPGLRLESTWQALRVHSHPEMPRMSLWQNHTARRSIEKSLLFAASFCAFRVR